MEVYFDHASAALPGKAMAEKFKELYLQYGANQESGHSAGYRTRQVITAAGETLAQLYTGNAANPVIWGNSATELFSLIGSFPEFRCAVTTTLEHPALLANLRRNRNCEILKCRRDGSIIAPDAAPATDIIACHQVQSELGIIQDTAGIFAAFPAETFRLVDAVQGAGKIACPPDADGWIISGVKFGSPGGAALILRAHGKYTTKLQKYADKMRHQEYRIGRVQPAVILAMVEAFKYASADLSNHFEQMRHLNEYIRNGCAAMNLTLTLPETAPTTPYILNMLLPAPYESGVIVRTLSDRGIHAASGSACSAESPDPSPAVTALGIDRKSAYRALRLSFAAGNTISEADYFLATLNEVLKQY